MIGIFGYKSELNKTPYWYGKVNGSNKQFVRIIVGLVLPHLDRQPAAAVVVGELYRSFAKPDLTVLAACVDQWPAVKTALIKFHEQFKFGTIVADSEASRKELWRIDELISALTYAAPENALTEGARQTVVGMLKEGRFRYDEVEHIIDHEPEQGQKAIQCAAMHALEFPALYMAEKKGQPQYQRMAGSEGL